MRAGSPPPVTRIGMKSYQCVCAHVGARSVRVERASCLSRWGCGLATVVVALGLAAPALADTPEAAPTERATDRPYWVSLSASSFMLGYRAQVPFGVGPELGAYVLRRLRLVARLAVPVAQAGDACSRGDVIYGDEMGVYNCIPSEDASLAYGASAGFVLVDTSRVAFAPGVTFLRSDESDHGTLLGASLPVEWVVPEGPRLGLELGLGFALGQRVLGRCRNNPNFPCETPTRQLPNFGTKSGFAAVSVGWSFR